MKQSSFDAARNEMGLVFRPIVISAMVTCIAAAWVWILETVLVSWRGTYVIGLVFVVTLETLLVERQLRRRREALQEPRAWRTRMAEIGMMLLLVKAASYVPSGWQQLARDIPQWVVEPESFFTFEFVIGILIVGTMWVLASTLAGNLAEIEDENSLPGDPEAARSSLQDEFLFGALILLVAAGAQRLALSPGGLSLRPAVPGPLTILPVIYVALGVLLFGQVRLSLLLARWKRQEVPVLAGIERRWVGWSALFVVGISALVLLLPAGETSLGVYLLTFIALVMLFLGQLVGFLLYLLLSLIFLPFGFLRSAPPLPPRLPQFPEIPPEAEAAALPGWLSSARMAVIAAILVIFVLFIVGTYWHDRRASGIWKTIGDLLYGVWNAFLAWLSGSRRRVQEIFKRAPARRSPESPRISLAWWRAWRAHTARERVRRLYLALLERAARIGHPRRPAQTPFEYATDLEPHVDDAEGLATLTDAFVQARYSRRDFTPAQVSLLHRLWQRLQAQLRRR